MTAFGLADYTRFRRKKQYVSIPNRRIRRFPNPKFRFGFQNKGISAPEFLEAKQPFVNLAAKLV